MKIWFKWNLQSKDHNGVEVWELVRTGKKEPVLVMKLSARSNRAEDVKVMNKIMNAYNSYFIAVNMKHGTFD